MLGSCYSITSCSPWQRSKESATWYTPGCTLTMATPVVSCGGLGYTLAVFLDRVISPCLCTGRGQFPSHLVEGKRCDECLWLCNLANVCLTMKEKRFLNEIYQQINSLGNYVHTITCLLLFLTPFGSVGMRIINLSTTLRLASEISWSFPNTVDV